MAIILCSHSGVQFSAEHFPMHLTQNELAHPIFYVPLKRLWRYYPKWQSGELTPTDSYLLFLALLNATELVEFRTAALQHADTDRIVQTNMSQLYETIGHISSIRNPRFTLPRFAITKDTRKLTNVNHWIGIWESTYTDYRNGLKESDSRGKLQKREAALERLIRNPAIKPERYAHLLANWAAIAGSFPTFSISVNGYNTTLSEYWQSIIIRCYRQEEIIQIPEKDLRECIEHCEMEIDLGSIYSYQLFTTLREGLQTIQGFFSNPTQFSILGESDSVGDSNLQLLIDSAPVAEPCRKDYPSDFAFLKAKMKWSLAASQSQVKEI